MRTVNRIELFAKPEVKSVLEEVRNVARRALPDCDVGEREAAMLAIFEEAGRGLLEEDLQAIADGLDERVLVDGIEHSGHEPGTVKYHCLSGVLRVRRHTYRRADIRNGRRSNCPRKPEVCASASTAPPCRWPRRGPPTHRRNRRRSAGSRASDGRRSPST